MQFVGDLEKQSLAPAPALEGVEHLHPVELLLAQPGAASQAQVLGELVVAARQCRDPQDHQLGLPARQGAARHQLAGEVQPAPEQSPVATQGQEDRRRLGAGDPARDAREAADERPHLA